MTLPTFRADDDPGPSFLDVLARSGGGPRWTDLPPGTVPDHTHGKRAGTRSTMNALLDLAIGLHQSNAHFLLR